jgi:hypothetical protein
MTPLVISADQLAAALESRPPECLDEIRPALIEEREDGSKVFDTDHPAWKIAAHKYAHRIDLSSSDPDTSPDSPRVGGCCGPPAAPTKQRLR